MDVQFAKTDDLHAILTITLSPADYQPAVEKEMREVQKKVTVQGFRPGKAPMGMLNKTYRRSVLVDEINKMASDQLFSYLRDNKIDVLGQPMMSETAESKLNFDVEGDFVLSFDLGLAPSFEINIGPQDTLTKYKIKVEDSMVEEEITNLKRRHATIADVETAGEKDVIYGEVTELADDNTPMDGGMENKPISFTPDLVKNEALKNQLIGVAKEAEIVVNIFDLFNDNATVISNTLGIPKEGVNDLNPNFRLRVTEIKQYTDAELGQELYDKVFGPGNITTEEEFRQKISQELERYYDTEADHHLEHEISHLLSDKHTFDLPDTFLKRWLLESNSKTYTPQNIDTKYEQEKAGLRYSLVRQRFEDEHGIEISNEEIENASLGYTYNLFAQYGMQNADAAMVKAFSEEQLKKEDHQNRMHDIALNRAVIQKVKGLVTIEEKEVGAEEFYQIISAHNHAHHDHEEHSHEAHDHDDHDHEGHDHNHEGHSH